MPTEFDWRIGVLDREPLYACQYYMAQGHWQIIRHERRRARTRRATSRPARSTRRRPRSTALGKAANLIGDGLYGVDIKQTGGTLR